MLFCGAFDYFSQEIEDAGGNIIKGLENGMLKILYKIGEWIVKNIFEPFMKGFKDTFKIDETSKAMWDLGTKMIKGLLDGISRLVNNVKTIATKIWTNFTTALSNIAKWVNERIIQPTINVFTRLFNNVKLIGKNIYKGFTGSLSNIYNFVKTKIVNPVIDKFNSLKDKVFSIFNKIKEKVTGVFSNLNIKLKTPHFSWTSEPASGWIANVLEKLNLPTSLPKLHIDWYASGGYPNEGDLFFANEAGPEMIGKIGNKTAVANNDQITRAIAEATYQAVSQALHENQDSNQPIIVNVGNETLYKGMTRSRSQASNQYGITV